MRHALRFLILSAASGLLLGLAHAQSQAWEKLITPGLTYRMEVDYNLPRTIHALRYTAGSGKVFSRPELAGGAVFLPDDSSKGRESVPRIASNTGAIAGINADFFPFTGKPVGLMVRGGELISLPYGSRAAFAWGPGYSYSGPVSTTINIRGPEGLKSVNMLNQVVPEDTLGLFTPVSFKASSKTKGVYVLLTTENVLPSSGVINATVNLLSPDMSEALLGANQMILVATGKRIADVMALRPGVNIQIEVTAQGIDATKAIHAIGGGPRLISGGKQLIDLKLEAFEPSFSTTLHPRSAIGSTPNGDIWFVVVDGRQSMSRGCTLDELAKIMIRLGCTEAINLDGGGSSCLTLGAMPLNRPSDNGQPRLVSNGVFLFGEAPAPDPNVSYVIKGLPQITEGDTAIFSVIDIKGDKVPLNQVIWSAQGAAWIDQAGTLRSAGTGSATVTAYVRGTFISVPVTVAPKPKS